jgi:pilus assembly protein Flp/PilA
LLFFNLVAPPADRSSTLILETWTMRATLKRFVEFVKKEDGPTAVEYAVMLALIVVVCIAAITTLGSNANSTFSFVGSAIAPPASSSSSSS